MKTKTFTILLVIAGLLSFLAYMSLKPGKPRKDEAVMGSDGAADIKKVLPLVFTPDAHSYYGIGDFLGKAFSIGEGLNADR